MIMMYRKYYQLWIDFDIFYSLLALLGLQIAFQDYHSSFEVLHVPSTSETQVPYEEVGNYLDIIVLLITIACGFVR
jgi:hypothetical protein